MNKDITTANAATLTLEETDRVIAALKSVSGNRSYTTEALALLTKLERAAQAARQSLWQEQYRAEQGVTEKRIAACRYCKTAQKRGKSACRKHREESRLNYVTSPISESYWAN